MSKKLVCGADYLILDVKYGKGAFMKTLESAEQLAKLMVNIGALANKKVTACVSQMNSPLGDNIGNTLEVYEAIEVLKGNLKNKLYDICIEYYSIILNRTKNVPYDTAKNMAIELIDRGKALNKFYELIKSQYGDVDCLNTKYLIDTTYMYEFKADTSGYINEIDALKLGKLFVKLGGGRINKSDDIDYKVGISLMKRESEYVEKGNVLAKVYYNDVSKFDVNDLKNVFVIEKTLKSSEQLISKIFG